MILISLFSEFLVALGNATELNDDYDILCQHPLGIATGAHVEVSLIGRLLVGKVEMIWREPREESQPLHHLRCQSRSNGCRGYCYCQLCFELFYQSDERAMFSDPVMIITPGGKKRRTIAEI